MTFLDEFESWCLHRGSRTKSGRKSLARSTSVDRRRYLARILRDCGYLREIGRREDSRFVEYVQVEGRDWRRIAVQEIFDFMQRSFPPGQLSVQQKTTHDQYAATIRTFADWGRDTGLWGDDKYLQIREGTTYLSQASEYDEIRINPPEIARPFCEWLYARSEPLSYMNGPKKMTAEVPRVKTDAMMIYLGQNLAMRYEETSDVTADLTFKSGGSLEINWRDMDARILGKGRRGKTRGPIPIVAEVRERIEDFLAFRERELGAAAGTFKWLLWSRAPRWKVGQGGDVVTKLAIDAGAINRRLQGYAIEYNDHVRSLGRVDLLLDVELCSTHKLGRHVFGTRYAPQLERKLLKRLMGIVHDPVIERYINYSDRSAREAFETASVGAKTTKVLTTRSSTRSSSSSSSEILCRKCDVSFPEYALWERHHKQFHGGGA